MPAQEGLRGGQGVLRRRVGEDGGARAEEQLPEVGQGAAHLRARVPQDVRRQHEGHRQRVTSDIVCTKMD